MENLSGNKINRIRVTVVNLITKQITPLIYSLSKIENIVGRNRS